MNRIVEILKKYDYDFSDIYFNQSIANTIDQIEEDLIYKLIPINTARKIMAELWKLQKSDGVKILEDSSLKEELKKIILKPGYSRKNEFIVCNKFISCTAIKTFANFHILTVDQIQTISMMGYGIKSFKVEIDSTIRDIYCTGKHPNLSSSNKSFCMDNDLKDIEFTSDNFDLIENMLSQINLSSNFLEEQEFLKIRKVVE